MIKVVERTYIAGVDHLVDRTLLAKKSGMSCCLQTLCSTIFTTILVFLIIFTVMYFQMVDMDDDKKPL